MSFNFIKEMPKPEEIKSKMAISKDILEIKDKRDQELKDIFTGKDDRFILIIGPCSADAEEPVIDYINRLAVVQQEVKDKIFIVPRIYTNKPRTTGEGYKGMVHQPDPDKKTNMYEGILAIRRIHIRALEETKLSCADEMLYPENYAYLDDLLSYVAIGARSVENQQHRLTVSGLDIPAGMKNPTSGDISVMLNAIRAAQVKQSFIYRGWEVKTKGNPLTHAIMRGAVNKHGRNIPNYHYEDIMHLIEAYEDRELDYPGIIIDINHSNSNKQFHQQPRIAHEIVTNCRIDKDFRKYVRGLMVESYIEEGNQKIGNGVYGKSITDPCLGWEDTRKMIYDIADRI